MNLAAYPGSMLARRRAKSSAHRLRPRRWPILFTLNIPEARSPPLPVTPARWQHEGVRCHRWSDLLISARRHTAIWPVVSHLRDPACWVRLTSELPRLKIVIDTSTRDRKSVVQGK